jgi:2,7-dihydroxy-5-methyl-1-naphthoate 7-O-methyltransferase
LISKSVFLEPEAGQFSLNETARGLLDPSRRLGLDLEGIGGRMAYAWGSLLTYVRTGAPAYQEIFGLPFWDDLDTHPTIAASFDAHIGPAGHGAPNPDFQITGGWEPVRSVVDVGGGTGAMLAEILRARLGAHASCGSNWSKRGAMRNGRPPVQLMQFCDVPAWCRLKSASSE